MQASVASSHGAVWCTGNHCFVSSPWHDSIPALGSCHNYNLNKKKQFSHHFLPFCASGAFLRLTRWTSEAWHGMAVVLVLLQQLQPASNYSVGSPQHAAPGPTSSLPTENHRAQTLSAATGIKIFQCKKLKLFVTSMKETGSTKWETCLLSAVCLQLRTWYFWWKASAQLLYLFPDVQTRPNVDLKSFIFQELIMIW